jgi:flagellar biosynthetic protein FliR
MITANFMTLADGLAAFLWPFVRIGAFLVAAPLFSLDAVLLRVRILLALALTFMIYNLLEAPEIDPLSLAGIGQILIQIYLGLMLGFILQIVTAAVALAGQAIANSMGLGFANLVDPAMGNIPVLSQFLVILATFIFLAVGGHLLVISLLLESFFLVPIGSVPEFQQWPGILMNWLPMLFIAGLNLSLPLLVSILLVNIGLGIVTRSAPALNIISVGFPAILLAGLILLNFALPGMMQAIERLWLQSYDVMRILLEA